MSCFPMQDVKTPVISTTETNGEFSQRQIKVLLFHLTAFSFSSGSIGKGDGAGKMSAKDLYGKSTFHS